jgi:histidine triad (HIT) family protein
MEECIFCKIAKDEIPCAKIWESENYLAFLDINPITQGMTLVIPKNHKSSDIFQNSDEEINGIMLAAKKVSRMLTKSLPIDRVGVIFEGVEVPHLHIKLIPMKKGENVRLLLNSHFAKPDTEELQRLAAMIRNSEEQYVN